MHEENLRNWDGFEKTICQIEADYEEKKAETAMPVSDLLYISGPEVGIAYGFNTFGTRYFEIYTVDLLHANFADDFQLWHGMIHQ